MNHFVGPFFLCNAQWEIIALIFSYWGQNTLVVLPKILFKFAILAADCKNAIKACCTVRNNCLNFLLLRPKHTGSFAQNSVQIDLILRCRLLRCSNSGVCEICNANNGCCTVGDNYQRMTCYLFWVAAPATPQPKIPPHPQSRATCFFDGRNSQAQPQLYQILALVFILSFSKLVTNGFFGSKFALNC